MTHAAIDDLLHTRRMPLSIRRRCYQARLGTYAMIDARRRAEESYGLVARAEAEASHGA
jgi:hypothetical protein